MLPAPPHRPASPPPATPPPRVPCHRVGRSPLCEKHRAIVQQGWARDTTECVAASYRRPPPAPLPYGRRSSPKAAPSSPESMIRSQRLPHRNLESLGHACRGREAAREGSAHGRWVRRPRSRALRLRPMRRCCKCANGLGCGLHRCCCWMERRQCHECSCRRRLGSCPYPPPHQGCTMQHSCENAAARGHRSSFGQGSCEWFPRAAGRWIRSLLTCVAMTSLLLVRVVPIRSFTII